MVNGSLTTKYKTISDGMNEVFWCVGSQLESNILNVRNSYPQDWLIHFVWSKKMLTKFWER